MGKIKESKHEFLMLIFLFVGIALLVGSGIFFKLNLDAKNKYLTTEAEIVEIRGSGDSHSVYVTYEVDGVMYKHVRINMYSSSMYEGKIITIHYDPADPSKTVLTDGYMFAFILLLIMGSVFSLVGGTIVFKKLRKISLTKKIMRNGTAVRCFVTSFETDRSLKVNGSYVNCFLFCRPFNDATKTFKSASFRFEYNVSEGDILNVYINNNSTDSENYYVDLSSLDGKNINMLSEDEKSQIIGLDEETSSLNSQDFESIEAKPKYCTYCGSRINGDEERCPSCNSSLL